MIYRDIAFCILNAGYIDPAIVSITSFRKYNRNVPLICYLEKGGDYTRLYNACQHYSNIEFKEVQFPSDAIFDRCGGKWLLIPREGIPAISMRIKVLQELASKYDRIINFDLDTLFCNSINNLLAVADSDHIYGVDEKENRLTWIKALRLTEWISGDYYFNTGFCLYGGRLIRDRLTYEGYINSMRASPERYNCPEQDYLNSILLDRFIRIRPSYNMLSHDREYTNLAPIMIHYYGVDKPWRREAVFTGNNGFYNRRYLNEVNACRGWLSDEFVSTVIKNCDRNFVFY